MTSVSICMWKSLSIFPFWRTILPGIVFTLDRCFFFFFFFSAFWIYHLIHFELQNLWWKNPLLVLLILPCMRQITFLLQISKFSLSLTSENMTIMCLSVNFFRFFLLEVIWVFCMWMWIFLPRFSKFSVIIPLHNLSAPLLLVFFSDFYNTYIVQLNGIS